MEPACSETNRISRAVCSETNNLWMVCTLPLPKQDMHRWWSLTTNLYNFWKTILWKAAICFLATTPFCSYYCYKDTLCLCCQAINLFNQSWRETLRKLLLLIPPVIATSTHCSLWEIHTWRSFATDAVTYSCFETLRIYSIFLMLTWAFANCVK